MLALADSRSGSEKLSQYNPFPHAKGCAAASLGVFLVRVTSQTYFLRSAGKIYSLSSGEMRESAD